MKRAGSGLAPDLSLRVRSLLPLAISVLALVGSDCGGATVAWRVTLDPGAAGAPLGRALLGHYDLSGALFAYDRVPGLPAALAEAGLTGADWRVGLGRWEAGTQLLPALSDGTPCPIPTPAAAAPAGATDLTLLAARDWFTDDGAPVTLAHTQEDARYALAYARRALDVAAAFGAKPFLSVDLMPRALGASRTPERRDCLWSFTNRVSNVRPASDAVFAAAVRGAVQRLRLGHGGAPGRAFTHVEIWNEPELPYFWDAAFEASPASRDRFFGMAIQTLVALDAWRAAAAEPEVRALRFGLAGFASADAAARVVAAFDAALLPDGSRIPLDFLSFHAYADDPEEVARAIGTVTAAVAASAHYHHLELVLSEWGPDLQERSSDPAYAASIDPALHAASVVARGAALGLGRAHHAILWDFYPDDRVTLGLVDHAGAAKPLQRAFALLARAIPEGAVRLAPPEAGDGRLGGDGAVLATRDAAGALRVLFVNRGTSEKQAEVVIDGAAALPRALSVYASPSGGIVAAPSQRSIRVPARSLVLAEL